MVFTCYKRSNWFNIIDIQDYDGSGLIYVTQNFIIFHQNIGIAVVCAIGRNTFPFDPACNLLIREPI